MSEFIADGSRVLMVGEHAPAELNVDQIERLLTVFDEAHAVRPYLSLSDAALKAGLPPRVSSLRSVA